MSITNTIYKTFNLISPFYGSFKKDRLRVLAYHTVPDQEAFELQLQHLTSCYSVISIEDLYKHLFRGFKLPAKPLLITFDDGDISVKENGLPLLKTYNLPSVMFIITSLINTKNMFWCRQVEHVLQEDGASYKEARAKVVELKNTPNKERVKYLKSLRQVRSKQLALKDLKEMEASGMFIGNHTHSHPMIDNCTTQEVKEELTQSKQCFNKWNFNGYSIFAYPNGNWDVRNENLLVKNNIQMAFLFDHKINRIEINPMRISRLRIDSDQPIEEFKVKVSGLHSKLMHFKEKYLLNSYLL